MSNLFSIDRLHFFPINQLISFVFKSICFLFMAICSFQFNLQSKCNPRYFTASVWGKMVWLILTAGQWPFRRVNLMCDDLDSLTLIFHFFSYSSMMCKCSWRLRILTIKQAVYSFKNTTMEHEIGALLWQIHRRADYSSNHPCIYITLKLSAYVTRSF